MALEKRQLGDFILEKKLGAGGMGEVYKAHQASLDRLVAVKVLPKSLAAQESFIERFQREAKAAANLIHPNVIQIYSIGIEGGIPYFAMEYVEGEDLQERMKRVKLVPPEESVEITAGVTNALACAYEKGIVHRDIKPSNIMIDRNGVVKVMDFGLAKVVSDSTSNLTQSGLIMGTPNYISPEQGKGDPIDGRSDIYSLGVVFYELLTGVLPFRADTPAALIYKHAFEMPDLPTKLKEGVPPFLEEICLRMLQKDPRDRYPNPKSLLADINEFRRNPAYYLKGGLRKGPPPYVATGAASGAAPDRTFLDPTGSQSGSKLGFGSGSLNLPGAGSVVGAGSSIIRDPMSTGTFRSSETHSEEDGARKPTLITVPERPGGFGPFATIAGVILLVAGVGTGVYIVTSRNGAAGTPGNSTPNSESGKPPVGGKVLLPLSRLQEHLPAGTKVFLIKGFDTIPITVFIDRQDVEPGTYNLQFEREGYKPIVRSFEVGSQGIKPGFEELRLAFEPTTVLLEMVERGKRAMDDTPPRYHEAVSEFEKAAKVASDLPGLAEQLGTARRLRDELRTAHARGGKLVEDRKWDQAKEALRDIPPSYESIDAVRGLRATCDQKAAQIKSEKRSFDRELAFGNYDVAKGVIDALSGLVPDGDKEIEDYRGSVKKGETHFGAARRYVESEQWREAKRELDELQRVSPEHRTANEWMRKAREWIASQESVEETVETNLKEAEEAMKAGQPERARAAAIIILDKAKGHAAATRIKADAERMILEREIVASFVPLDKHFLDRKLFNMMNLVDTGSAEAYKQVQADAEAFFAAAIEVRRSEHKEFTVTVDGTDKASVECLWEIDVYFKEAELGTPRVEPARTISIRQKVGLRRGAAGVGWVFTSFQQLGEANVR